jgi:hypothetical protein
MTYIFKYTFSILFATIICSSIGYAQTAVPNTGTPVIKTESQGGQSDTGAGLVQCGRISSTGKSGDECTFKDLITLVGDTISFIIKNVIIPLLILGLVYHGARMVIFKNKTAEIEKIKKGIWSMLIGIFFMLTAWLLVETITTSFGVKYSTDPKTGVVDFLK